MIRAILFDCDGVIIDSYASSITFLQNTFAHFHLPVPQDKDFYPHLGKKTPDIITIFTPNLSKDEFDKIYAYAMQESMKVAPSIPLIPHAKQIIQKLSEEQYILGVISNRGKTSLDFILSRHNLTSYFSVILGREDVQFQKPHPEPILKALHTLSAPPTEAIYIGDTAIDAQSAKSAHVPSIIYNDPHIDADYHIADLQEIQTIVKKL